MSSLYFSVFSPTPTEKKSIFGDVQNYIVEHLKYCLIIMSDKISDPFWFNNPKVLFTTWEFIPTQTMTNAERLNTLTRLLLLITVGMYLMDYEHYITVLVLGFLLILILRGTQKENFSPRRGAHDPCHTCGFDSNMAYINTKYETSPQDQFSHTNDGLRSYTHAHYKVIPTYIPAPYSEVWRKEPRFCNEFSRYPNTYNIIPSQKNYQYVSENFSQPENKCHFEDREWVQNVPGGKCPPGKVSAMPAVQSAFMRDSLEFRNNIMGDYVDQFERQRQHNCVGFKPGRKTF